MAGRARTNKSILGKWWFWLIVIIIAIGSVGNNGNDDKKLASNGPTQSIVSTLQPTTAPNPTQTTIPSTRSTPVGTPIVSVSPNKASDVSGTLKVHFIDVGQADSILLQQGDSDMLIDGGNNADANLVTSYLKEQGVTKLDYVIGTHPHEDHIGGLDAVIKNFNIGSVIMPKAKSNTKTFEDLLTAIQNKSLKITAPVPGTKYKLGDAEFTVLAPNSSTYDDTNNYSVVIKLTYGNSSFLFTGDAQDISESEILSKGYNLKSDVLKVGHHGSDSSTSSDFLGKVGPKYAVIMVGADNSYGHPHSSTMEKLKNKGIKVYRTDENGTIVCTSDGKNISFSCNPGSYAAGSSKESSSGSSSSSTSAKPTSNGTTTNEMVGGDPNKIVYYTPGGKSYHFSKSCSTLSRSQTILSGKLKDVMALGKSDPCNRCVF